MTFRPRQAVRRYQNTILRWLHATANALWTSITGTELPSYKLTRCPLSLLRFLRSGCGLEAYEPSAQDRSAVSVVAAGSSQRACRSALRMAARRRQDTRRASKASASGHEKIRRSSAKPGVTRNGDFRTCATIRHQETRRASRSSASGHSKVRRSSARLAVTSTANTVPV